jgi:hypothetical protein
MRVVLECVLNKCFISMVSNKLFWITFFKQDGLDSDRSHVITEKRNKAQELILNYNR